MTRRAGAALLAGLLAVAPGAAQAHDADPRIAVQILSVEPALPDDVVVQAQPGIATQLVVRNPTTEVLEVLDAQARPFLRISSAGVLADVGAKEFFTTSSPTGAAPSGTQDGPVRWVQISTSDSWGWYDHRLHPVELRAPDDQQRPARLADVEVPLRYANRDVTVQGEVVFRPLLGSFLVSADPAPPGLQVQALPGRLPALFLRAEPGADVTVLGRDGEPFLRITAAGVEVNQHSRTHVEDRAARGQEAGPPAPAPAFALVTPGTRSYTWLDARLRYPDDLPPDNVLRAGEATRLEQWRVPVRVDGRAEALTGDITWVPEPDAAARVAPVPAPADRRPLLTYGIALAAAAGLAGGVLLLRRRTAAQRRR